MSPRDRDHESASAGSEPASQPESATAPTDDHRHPYEPPRVMKRRSVVSATLQSPMGPASLANTMQGGN